jgi:hypothetical protein
VVLARPCAQLEVQPDATYPHGLDIVDALGVAGTGARARAKDVVLQPQIKGLGLDGDAIRDGPFGPHTATMVRLIPVVAKLPAFWGIEPVNPDTWGANVEVCPHGIRRTRSSAPADQASRIGMTAQPDFCDFETPVLEELIRRSQAALLMRQQTAGTGSLADSAGALDNVVRHPARHSPPPIPRPVQVDAIQAPAAPHHGQRGDGPTAIDKTVLERFQFEAIKRANESRAWYDNRATRAKKMSRRLRACAIAYGLLGGLCPLLPDSVFAPVLEATFNLYTGFLAHVLTYLGFPSYPNVTITPSGTGLVFFLLAGACLLIDQVFGYSSSFARFRLIELKLGKQIRMFELEVHYELAKCGGKFLPEDRADGILADLKAFVARVEDINIEDTETWIDELKAGLLQIEQFTTASSKSVVGQRREVPSAHIR